MGLWGSLIGAAAVSVLCLAPLPIANSDAGYGDDSYLSPSGNQGIDIQHYDVKLRYDQSTHGIANANVTITIQATNALRNFSLDARNGLTIRKVTLGGKPTTFNHSGRKLTVSGFGSIASGDNFQVKVRYRGKPRPIQDKSGRGVYGWLPTPGGSVTYTEPTGTSTWIPSNDVFSDKATWTTELTTPSDLLGVSTGTFKGISREKNLTTSRWRMNTPIQPYLQTVAIDRFRHSTRKIAGLPSFTAVAKGSGVSVRTMERRTARAIRWLGARLGRYPFESTGAIVVSGRQSAMETAGRPTYSRGNFWVSQETVLHEQAHQWFGNTLTARLAKDMWLHEGFATYLENVERAERKSRSLDDIVHGQYVQDGWYSGFRGQFNKVPLSDPSPRYLLNSTPYFRGQAAVHSLRSTLGDELFWQVLGELVRIPAGTTTDTETVVDRAEAISGVDLSQWSSDWLYSTGYQELPVAPSYRQVMRELGPEILNAAATYAWRPRGDPQSAMEEAIGKYSPTNQLRINSVERRTSSQGPRYLIEFTTAAGPLYPNDDRSCFVLQTRDDNILAGAYLGIRISDKPRVNHFSPGSCQVS